MEAIKKEEDIDFLLYEQAQKYQKELSDIVHEKN